MRKFSVRTVFAYDWPLALVGMEHVVAAGCAIDLVAAYPTAAELVAAFDTVDCHVLLVDYSLRGDGRIEGLALLERLTRVRPEVGIVALVRNESPVILRSILAHGATSVVSKGDDVGHIVTAVHSAYSGGRYLSPLVRRALDASGSEPAPAKLSSREVEVIRLYLSGIPIKAIAQRLNKGKQTVSAQKISAMKKLGAHNDVELIRYAAGLGLGGTTFDATVPRVRGARRRLMPGAGAYTAVRTMRDARNRPARGRRARRGDRAPAALLPDQAGSAKRVTASRSASA